MQHYTKVLFSSALLFFAPLVATAFEKARDNGGETNTVRPSAEDTQRKAATELSDSGDNGASPQDAQSNTIIGLPSFGNLGYIPNLDFGMELLYGQENKPVEEVSPEEDEDTLQIRGSIKHRF